MVNPSMTFFNFQDFYVNEGKYLGIKGTGSVEEIFNRITDAIKEKCGK